MGKRNEAIADYDQAIRLNPKYAVAYNNRGNARSVQGDKQRAINDFDQAIRLNPNFAAAYNNRGNTRAAIGDKQGAISDLQQAAKIFQKQKNTELYQQVMQNIKDLQR